MNTRLIRAAIAFYPPDWRQRYGGELEQLVADAWIASAGSIRKAWLVAGVAACGIRERVRKRVGSHAPRILGTLATAVAAAAVVFAISGGDQNSGITESPTPVTLAPGVRLSALVEQTEALPPLQRPKGAHHILVTIAPVSKTLVAITGAPATVELNPRTKQVLSITPRSR